MYQGSGRKQEALATAEAVALTARKVRGRKRWWLCEESRLTEGEDNTILLIGCQEDCDEIVLLLSAMVVEEDRDLEYGGLGEEDEIEGNVDASSRIVRLVRLALVRVFSVHTPLS